MMSFGPKRPDRISFARKPRWGARHLQNHLTIAQAGGVKRKSGRHLGEAETTRPGPLRSLLPMRLTDVDNNTIKAWLSDEIERGPSQAEQAFRIFRTFIGWCCYVPPYFRLTDPSHSRLKWRDCPALRGA